MDTHLLIIAVPDTQIAIVDRSIAKIIPKIHLQACVHTSGALPGSVLTNVSTCGVAIGSLHPLQTFPSKQKSPSLEGVYFAVEGDPAALELLQVLTVQLKGISVLIPSERKALYHASAVFASNFLPAILRVSVELLNELGISPSRGRKMLAPLMENSLENCLRASETEALTGPIARGDAPTVAMHLEAIRSISPSATAIYRMLSLKTLEIAVERGLDESSFESIRRILTG